MTGQVGLWTCKGLASGCDENCPSCQVMKLEAKPLVDYDTVYSYATKNMTFPHLHLHSSSPLGSEQVSELKDMPKIVKNPICGLKTYFGRICKAIVCPKNRIVKD